MKRDLALLRTILLRIEEVEDAPTSRYITSGEAKGLKKFSADVIKEHIRLLLEAHYLDGIDISDQDIPSDWLSLRITWQGHDFLDAIRDPRIVARVKKSLKDSSSVPLEVLKQRLIRFMNDRKES